METESLDILAQAVGSHRDWLDYVSALLLPLAVLAAAWLISRRQSRITEARLDHEIKISDRKFRHGLYDKRLDLYKDTVALIATVIAKKDVPEELKIELLRIIKEAKFLFGKDVEDYLSSIQKRFNLIAGAIFALKENNAIGPKFQKEMKDEIKSYVDMLEKDFNKIEKVFEPYLNIAE